MLKIWLLGNLHVRLNGVDITTFESIKVRALLAYLATEAGRSHLRGKLAGLLWPDWPQQAAMSNLRYALADLRKNIGDREANPPCLLVNRESLQFNPQGDWWVDCVEFERLLNALPGDQGDPKEKLVEAVEIFKGEFLEGFTLDDSPDYERWILEKREYYRGLALKTCLKLAESDLVKGEFEKALGYAQRGVELEPWLEDGQRLVMRLLSLMGRRSEALAQYEKLKSILQEELGVAPSQETVDLYEQIRGERLGRVKELPGFMKSELTGESQIPPVVAREGELSRLHAMLDQSVAGDGMVALLTGEAGRGKTTLINEFIRRSQDVYHKLLVVQGNCQSYFGRGDPYLPFREILVMLMGEVEERWRAGTISQEHARRIWEWLPVTARALVEQGPALIETLVPGQALLERVTATIEGEPGWVGRLREIVAVRQKSYGGIQTTQDDLSYQYKNTLFAIARQAPLMLVLDDLQWADEGSLGLLFSLGKSLVGVPLLVVGAYREAEAGESLIQLVQELKLVYGDIEVRLGKRDEDEFAGAYLDTQPNRFSGEFRQRLRELTLGHPLFTVELLRGMLERGEVVRNEQGEWQETGGIDWEKLPARVEAAIGERVNRLPDELRELLKIASVQGECFLVEVLADVIGETPFQLIRHLSLQAESRYRLVRAEKLERIDNKRVTRFCFRHILIQRYLYQDLEELMRIVYHEQTASSLERYYDEKVGEILPQLARHYKEAGVVEKAIEYYSKSGERAARMYANAEAITSYRMALDLIALGDYQNRFKNLFGLVNVLDRTGKREEQREAIREMEGIVDHLELEQQAMLHVCKMRLADHVWEPETLRQEAEQVIYLAESTSIPAFEAEAFMMMMTYYDERDPYKALTMEGKALAIGREMGFRQLEADILRNSGIYYIHVDYKPEKVLEQKMSSLNIYREIGDRYGEGRVENVIGLLFNFISQYEKAIPHLLNGERLCQEVGNRHDQAWALKHLYDSYEYLGYQREEMIQILNRAIDIIAEVEHSLLRACLEFDISEIYRLSSDFDRALYHLGRNMMFLQKLNSTDGFCVNLARRGDILIEQQQYDLAYDCFYEALRYGEGKLGEFLNHPMAGLARIKMVQGYKNAALELVEKILPQLSTDDGFFYKDYQMLWDYLTCYQVLKANQDLRSEDLLETAHEILSRRANQIENEQLRQSYLENIPWNREIARLWMEQQPGNHP